MKNLIIALSILTVIGCGNKKAKKPTDELVKIDGICGQSSSGVSGADGCTIRVGEVEGDKDEITYKMEFSFDATTNSYVEFISSASDNLGKGITLRMQREGNLVRFYLRDHEKSNQEIMASDQIEVSGQKYQLFHRLKNGAIKMILSDSARGTIFDTSIDLVGVQTFNSYITAGKFYGFRIKNSTVKSAAY